MESNKRLRDDENKTVREQNKRFCQEAENEEKEASRSFVLEKSVDNNICLVQKSMPDKPFILIKNDGWGHPKSCKKAGISDSLRLNSECRFMIMLEKDALYILNGTSCTDRVWYKNPKSLSPVLLEERQIVYLVENSELTIGDKEFTVKCVHKKRNVFISYTPVGPNQTKIVKKLEYEKKCVIGTQSGNYIKIENEPYISGKHCIISNIESGVVLTVKGQNGIFMDNNMSGGNIIRQNQFKKLIDGSVIHIPRGPCGTFLSYTVKLE